MAALFAATLALVFLRGYQQQNVIHGHYIHAVITSYAMAVAEFFCFGIVAKAFLDANYLAILVVGTAGAIGVTASMKVKRNESKSKKVAGC